MPLPVAASLQLQCKRNILICSLSAEQQLQHQLTQNQRDRDTVASLLKNTAVVEKLKSVSGLTETINRNKAPLRYASFNVRDASREGFLLLSEVDDFSTRPRLAIASSVSR